MILLLRLFWEYFKTGLFAVGGGLATLPFLSEIADKTGWYTQAQLADMLAVSESTPGAIGVNMATYVGFTTSGVVGAIVATIGLITPSIIVILTVAAFLKSFRDNRFVKGVFECLRPASTGLITASGLSVVLLALVHQDGTGDWLTRINWQAVLLVAVLLVLTRGIPKTKGMHPVVWILFSAVIGIVFHFGGV